jgi:hypothetical protein
LILGLWQRNRPAQAGIKAALEYCVKFYREEFLGQHELTSKPNQTIPFRFQTEYEERADEALPDLKMQRLTSYLEKNSDIFITA